MQNHVMNDPAFGQQWIEKGTGRVVIVTLVSSETVSYLALGGEERCSRVDFLQKFELYARWTRMH